MARAPGWSPDFGDWRVDLLECGRFALDGGSMFGSVPRGIWERLIPPDRAHRIPLALRLMLLSHSSGARVLVDSGVGDKFDAKFQERFALGPNPADDTPLSAALGRAGVSLDQVTHLVLTHMHFDHGGGVSRRTADGSLVPTLPEAEHFLQRANLETAENPNPRERASYLPENVVPLRETSLTLLEGEQEVLPGLRLIPTNGHTDGMQIVRLDGGGRVLYFVADLAPTHHHLHLPITMGYDLCPREIMKEKQRIWQQAMAEEATLVFEHDPEVATGRITLERGKYRLQTP
ncbi:MAG: MBL fold metallo-hydrolase [Planctomycetota bacterium]